MLHTFADLTRRAVAVSEPIEDVRQQNLDDLVTKIATDLMAISADTTQVAHQRCIRQLAEFFGVDTSFLRRNDHVLGASVLVAEWPLRENVPDPDPLGVVPFVGSDPVFAAIEQLSEPFVTRPSDAQEEYQERVREGAGIPEVSLVMVPILDGTKTIGVIGFINFGDRVWRKAELNALQAVASLLAQLQGRVDAEHHLQYNAYHDELTGLPNRRALIKELRDRLAGTTASAIPLLFIDLDRLKSLNDHLGHAAGDHLLRTVAHRLRRALGPRDVVARLGGDEFVILLSTTSSVEEVTEVARRLLDTISEPLDVGGQRISRTACIGFTIGEAGTTTAAQLMRDADIALLAAKEAGGNSILNCTDDMRTKIGGRADLELDLRNAIVDGDIFLEYLPEYDLRTGEILSVEALVRWRHAIRGILAPEEFIEVAEESNIIAELGSHVLEQACAQLACWTEEFPDRGVVMRVNVAPQQLIGRDLILHIGELLLRYSLTGSELCLEITERGVMNDLKQVLSVLHEIRKLGVSIAMDDFGTGSSSLAKLKSLPVNTLKIDQSFIVGLGSNSEDEAIVTSIVRLAETFQLEVVAEGVETQEAVEELLKLGCYRAQGFLLQRPIGAPAFREMLLHPTRPTWLRS